jgi:ribosomal protein S18 acetylase RimI-like enzyme
VSGLTGPGGDGAFPDLGEPWGRHPFLVEGVGRWSIGRSWVLAGGVLLDTVLASGGRALVGLGEPDALAPVLADVLLGAAPPALVSVPRGVWDRLPPGARQTCGLQRTLEWDWLWCDAPPPPQPGEDRVVRLVTAAERAEVAGLLAVAYPSGWKVAADRPDQQWWGWRQADGTLLGSAGARPLGAGGPVRLGGVSTHPAARRRGIARALTAAVVRESLRTAPWVSLAIRADNVAARRLYLGLGFEVRAELETLRRERPGRADA